MNRSATVLFIAAIGGATAYVGVALGAFAAQGAEAPSPDSQPAAGGTAEPVASAGEVAGLDYQAALYDKLHFAPAVLDASDDECLACHAEILDTEPMQKSPAGVAGADSLAWYQTLATYEGGQQTFHWRHLKSDYSRAVMNLSCNFCHQGSYPREEAPPVNDAAADAPPPFTLRKSVNPSTTCLLCHGAMSDPEEIMGLPGPWPEYRADFEYEDEPNGCLSCHRELYRTNRHNVTYLNAAVIKELAEPSSDVCYGCHCGRQWYSIAYPYPRTPWPDMDPEVPDWAKDRPTQSEARFRLDPAGQ